MKLSVFSHLEERIMGNRCCSSQSNRANQQRGDPEIDSSMGEYLRRVPTWQQLQAYRQEAALRRHNTPAASSRSQSSHAVAATHPTRDRGDRRDTRPAHSHTVIGTSQSAGAFTNSEDHTQNPLATDPSDNDRSASTSHHEVNASAFNPLTMDDYHQRLAQMRLEEF